MACRYKSLELAFNERLSAHQALAVRQDLVALARLAAYTRECPPHLLAEATMHLAAAYGCLELHKQALSHANTSVMLSHELCEFLALPPSALKTVQQIFGNKLYTFLHDSSSTAIAVAIRRRTY